MSTDMSTDMNAGTRSDMSADPDDFRNPLARTRPLGGPTGVAIASVVPLGAIILFLAFGLTGGWSWSWMFFLLIPVVGVAVYGFGGSRRGGRG
jgi:hypothetical protein